MIEVHVFCEMQNRDMVPHVRPSNGGKNCILSYPLYHDWESLLEVATKNNGDAPKRMF